VRKGPLVVVGDSLLDRDVEGRVERLCPDAPAPVVDEERRHSRPGGAGLAAALAASDGCEVVLVTALSDDEGGRELADLLEAADVRVVDLGLDGPTPEKIRIRSGPHSLMRLDRGCAEPARVGDPGDETAHVLSGAAGVLVADYGRGVTASARVSEFLSSVGRGVPVVWDPHPRGARPVPGCRLVTPNRSEAAGHVPDVTGDSLAAHAQRARRLRDDWQAAAVAVTLGRTGALLIEGEGPPFVAPASKVAGGDPCGAGDRFAASAARLLARGALVSEAVVGAVSAASAFVAAGGAGALRFGRAPSDAPPVPGDDRSAPSAAQVIAEVRGRGGTVVATGGCFDIVHAGHIELLEGARGLGDCLVVCLNSDDSVRRLKGPCRPLASQEDRVAVLLALGCVDAVAVFDEDTPTAILDKLRPDVFVKGGDYAGADLPEAKLLAEWGGQAVVLPYLPGRSTSGLLDSWTRS
jgi:D-beta-D-heptose 7-phosphate kinase/D-beta-D-heptose 1-phosphate adenosyltransferase